MILKRSKLLQEDIKRILTRLSEEFGVKVTFRRDTPPLQYNPLNDEVVANVKLMSEVLEDVARCKKMSFNLEKKLRRDFLHELEHRRLLKTNPILLEAYKHGLYYIWRCGEALQDFLIETRILRHQEMVISDYVTFAKKYLLDADERLSDALTEIWRGNMLLVPYFLISIAYVEGGLSDREISLLKPPERGLVYELTNILRNLSEYNLLYATLKLGEVILDFLLRVKNLIIASTDLDKLANRMSSEVRSFQEMLEAKKGNFHVTE